MPFSPSGEGEEAVGRGGTPEVMESTVLNSGIQVVSEWIPSVRSVAVGVWVRQGGAHEGPREAGASHLLEHMVFKGTRNRRASEVAHSLESLGGSLDAYTTREHTAFQARVLDDHLPEAMDVLSDLVLEPLLRDEDLARERQVVLEELAQVEDTPDDLVFELHGARLWNDHPYGRPILGTEASVSNMSGDTLRAIHRKAYVGRNIVVAAAGNVDHDDLVERVRGHFAGVEPGERTPDVEEPGDLVGGDVREPRSFAQSHVVFGGRAPRHSDPARYALVVVSQALGGGMSSRLFQRVREELGLCYSVFSYQSFYRKAGLIGVYVGTRPATEGQAVEAIRLELDRVARDGMDPEWLAATKRQMKGQVMLSLESTGARLHRLASFALHEEPFLGLDGLLARIDGVTEEDVARVAARYLAPDRHLVLRLGPDPDVTDAAWRE